MFSIHYPGHARIALAMSIVALPYRAWGQDVPYEPTDIADPIVVTATRRLPSPEPFRRVVCTSLPVAGSVTVIGVPGCVPVPAAP